MLLCRGQFCSEQCVLNVKHQTYVMYEAFSLYSGCNHISPKSRHAGLVMTCLSHKSPSSRSETSSALTIAIFNRFWWNLAWISRTWNLKRKNTFVEGRNPARVSPIFYPILPQIGIYIMHFQWECWNTSGVACGRIIAVHRANDVAWRPPTPKC